MQVIKARSRKPIGIHAAYTGGQRGLSIVFPNDERCYGYNFYVFYFQGAKLLKIGYTETYVNYKK